MKEYSPLVKGNVEMVALLAAKMGNKNPQDDSGKTPLIWAILNNQTQAAKYLIDIVEDVSTEGTDGMLSLIHI